MRPSNEGLGDGNLCRMQSRFRAHSPNYRKKAHLGILFLRHYSLKTQIAITCRFAVGELLYAKRLNQNKNMVKGI